MTNPKNFHDLSPEDRDTAQFVLDAFADIENQTQGPHESIPSHAQSKTTIRPLPSRKRRSPAGWIAVAAAVVIAASALNISGPGGSSIAWAAEPESPTASEVQAINKACSRVIERGVGELQGSGTASADGSSEFATDGVVAPEQPTELPPLEVLDVRGDGAMAVYSDDQWQIVCLLQQSGGVWRDFGLTAMGKDGDAPAGLVASGSTNSRDGQAISYVSGAVPAGTTAVTFELSNGETVTASVLDGSFAAWFPGDASLVPGSLNFTQHIVVNEYLS